MGQGDTRKHEIQDDDARGACGRNCSLRAESADHGVKADYTRIKGNVMKAADDMPEGDYGFMPGAGSRTYGAAVVHIADVQAGLCGAAKGEAGPKI